MTTNYDDFYKRLSVGPSFGSGAPPYVTQFVSGGPGGVGVKPPGYTPPSAGGGPFGTGSWTPDFGGGAGGDASSGGSSGGSRVGGVVKKVGNWITNHPDATATIAGSALSLYGAHKDRQAATEQNAVENQQWQQDYQLRQREQAMRELEAQQKLQSDTAARMQRRAALAQIFGMYSQHKKDQAAANAVQMES